MVRILKRLRRDFIAWLEEPRIIWRSEDKERQVTIEVQQWLPLWIFLILLTWYLALPSPVAMMSMMGVGGILLADFLWTRLMARHVSGERKLRFTAMQVGDELEEAIGLVNDSLLPVLWAEFMDRSNMPGYTVSSARAVEAENSARWRAHTICTQRGVFRLGPWELRIGGPFGIFQVRQVYFQPQEILVYPPLAVLPEHILPHHGVMGDHRPLNQPYQAETITTNTVRAYTQGDPLRHIHWRTTARMLDPFVKVFEPEAASSIWLVPDFDESVHMGEGEYSSEETMVTAAASLAAELLLKNLSVGMFAAADQEMVVLPRQGQPYLWAILQGLAPLRSAPDRPLAEILSRASSLVKGNDLLIVITPSLRLDWIAPLQRIARSRMGRGRAEVILLDPASFNGEGDAQAFLSVLLEQGIPTKILRREEVQVISGYYGEVSRWEFTISATGRALPRKTPRSAAVMMAGGTFQPQTRDGESAEP